MAENKGIMIYFTFRDAINNLSMEDRGKLLTALIDFGADGLITEFEGELKMLYDCMCPYIKADFERYQKRCKTNQENAIKGRKTPSKPSLANASDGEHLQPNTIKENKSKKDEVKELNMLGATVI